MKYLILVLFTLLCLPSHSAEWDAIRNVLKNQERCWNQGDLPCFMSGYWQSDQLLFVGSRGLTSGWKTTLQHYQKSYPDVASMGKLSFEILEMKSLGSDHALVIGTWRLSDSKKKQVSGYFSTIWQKIDGSWKIIADHSS